MAHIHMNVEIVTEAAQFPKKEYINRIFISVYLLGSWRNSVAMEQETLAAMRRNSTFICGETPVAMQQEI